MESLLRSFLCGWGEVFLSARRPPPCSLSALLSLLTLSFSAGAGGGEGDEELCLLFFSCFFPSLLCSTSLLFSFLVCCFGGGEGEQEGLEEESCLPL